MCTFVFIQEQYAKKSKSLIDLAIIGENNGQ